MTVYYDNWENKCYTEEEARKIAEERVLSGSFYLGGIKNASTLLEINPLRADIITEAIEYELENGFTCCCF